MTSRKPAGDLGTVNRLPADDGHTWVRLMTAEAVRREGLCMRNCLRSVDISGVIGDENPLSNSIWSLRNERGLSVATAETYFQEVAQFEGPCCTKASGFAYQQLRHLVARFGHSGQVLDVAQVDCLTREDGMTMRRDLAPGHLQAAKRAEEEAAREAEELRQVQIEELVANFEAREGLTIINRFPTPPDDYYDGDGA